jgi:nucleoside phosphorylase
LEYRAVRALLTDVQLQEHPSGTLFETGLLPATRWRVVLAQIGEGNVAAAVVAERAATYFTPNLVLFVGVAGALKDDLVVGDVVVATRIYAYAGGKATAEEFLARPRSFETAYRLQQRASWLAATHGWSTAGLTRHDGLPPAVHLKPVAAGEVVLASRDSALFDLLRRHYNDAAAVEMESGGLAQAAQINDSLPTLTIRGISDTTGPDKTDLDAAGWQPRAAYHAASFAAALLAAPAQASAPGELPPRVRDPAKSGAAGTRPRRPAACRKPGQQDRGLWACLRPVRSSTGTTERLWGRSWCTGSGHSDRSPRSWGDGELARAAWSRVC